MADNRKYYYLKLKESFFDGDSIVLLESMPDGILYSNILLKLYLKSLKNGGRLQLDEHIPYTAQMIATLTRHQIGTVERAIKVFLQLGLVEQLDGGLLYMSDIELMIGQSSTEGERKRAARLENKALLPARTNGGHLSDIRPPEIEIKIEKEIEIEIEKERERETGQAPAAYGKYQNVFLSDSELITDINDVIQVFENNGGNAVLASDVEWLTSALYVAKPTILDLDKNSLSVNYLQINRDAGKVEIKNGTLQQLYKTPDEDDWSCPSALIVWNGNTVTLKDTTINTVDYSSGVNFNAIHVEDESEYENYELGKSVVILESGTVVNGNITIQGELAELYIKEGVTVDGKITTWTNLGGKVVITGGTFSSDVSQYLTDEYQQTQETVDGKTWYKVTKAS